MYKANLSYNQMNLYLDELMKKDVIAKVTEKKSSYFIITEKGYSFAEKIMEMRNFEKTFGI